MNVLEVRKILVEQTLQLNALVLSQGRPQPFGNFLVYQVLPTGVSYHKGGCFLQTLFRFQPIQNNESSFFALVHVESVRENDNHKRYNECPPDH